MTLVPVIPSDAQGVGQGGTGLDLQALLFAVDFEVNGNWTWTHFFDIRVLLWPHSHG